MPAFVRLSLLFALTATAHASILYVTDFSGGNGSVQSFDGASGTFLGTLSVPGGVGFPGAAIVGPDGNLYVVDNGNNVVDKFNASTGVFISQFIGAGGGLVNPTGLAFGLDGNLYVANQGAGGNSFISRFNGTTGAFISNFVPIGAGPAGGLFDPESIVFGPNGNLFVADTSNGGVDEFNATTAAFTQFVSAGSPLGAPFGLAFGPNGDLFLTDIVNSTVDRYNGTTGAFIGAFVPSSSTLDQPAGLVFGPDGNLYVTDALGRVAAFNGTTGAELADLVTIGSRDLNNPQFLTFFSPSGVPEPSTIGFAAFGTIALLARRRKRLLHGA